MKLKIAYSIVSQAIGTAGGSERRTHIARAKDAATLELLGQDSDIDPALSGPPSFATVTIKSCISLLCCSRPDLVPGPESDYAVSALDPTEISEDDGGKVFEGMGMMSWLLAEKEPGQTRVVGKVVAPKYPHSATSSNTSTADMTLEVVLELMPRKPILQTEFVSSLSSSKPVTQKMPLPPKPEIRTQQSLLAELVANIQTQQQDAAISTPALQLLRQLVEKAEELPPPINSSSRIAIPKKAGRPRKNKSISLEAPEAGGFVPIVLPEVDLSLRHRKTASNPLIEANIAQPAKPTYATSPVIAQFRHDDLQRPIASTSAHSSTQESVDVPKKLRYWAAGCCNCGKTESHGWRTRKKRKRPLHLQSKSSNGSEVDASIDAWQNMDEAKAKLCEECASNLPSVQLSKALREKNLASRIESESETVGTLPPSPSSRVNRTKYAQSSPVQRRSTNGAAALDVPLFTSRGSIAQTSPPRRQARLSAGNSITHLLNIVSGDDESDDSQPPERRLKKRPKLSRDSALSKAALKAQERNKIDPASLENRTEGDSASTLDKLMSLPLEISPNLSKLDASTAATIFGPSSEFASFGDNLAPNTGVAMDDLLFADLDVASVPQHLSEFLMNASPGTAMRAVLGESGPKGSVSPGKMLAAYLTDVNVPLLSGSPMSRPKIASTSADLGMLFSPGFTSSLSTPLRQALLSTGSPSLGSKGRSISEEPPSSHIRFQENIDTNKHISSDDNLLGSRLLQINLLPATVDRQRNNAASADAVAADSAAPGSDIYVDDFSDFLARAGSSLFSPSPPRATRAFGASVLQSPLKHRAKTDSIQDLTLLKPSLPPLARQRSQLYQSAGVATDNDSDSGSAFDLKDLPPSSPPPLPSRMSSLRVGNYLHGITSSLNGNQHGNVSDVDSPISVATTATPQDSLFGGSTMYNNDSFYNFTEDATPVAQTSFQDQTAAAQIADRVRTVTSKSTSSDLVDLSTVSTYTTNVQQDEMLLEQIQCEDPLLSYFTSQAPPKTAAAHPSPLDSAGSTVGMTWSDSAASNSSFYSLNSDIIRVDTKTVGERQQKHRWISYTQEDSPAQDD